MNELQLDALYNLVNYNWSDEERDFQEMGSPDDHIFLDLIILREFLRSQGVQA